MRNGLETRGEMFEKSAKFLRAEDDIKILLRLKQVAHLRVLLQVKSKVLTCAEISDTVLAVQEISEVNSQIPQFYFTNHIVGELLLFLRV